MHGILNVSLGIYRSAECIHIDSILGCTSNIADRHLDATITMGIGVPRL